MARRIASSRDSVPQCWPAWRAPGGETDEERAQRRGEGGRARSRSVGHGAEEKDLIGQRYETAGSGECQHGKECQRRDDGSRGCERLDRRRGNAVAVAPMRDERAGRNCAVDRNRRVDRTLHAEEWKQQHRAYETGGAGAERVDVVEQARRRCRHRP